MLVEWEVSSVGRARAVGLNCVIYVLAPRSPMGRLKECRERWPFSPSTLVTRSTS
jgi:hypothetical protein